MHIGTEAVENARVWRKVISDNHLLVIKSQGPAVFTVVSGNTQDAEYWGHEFKRKSSSLFRSAGDVHVISVCEGEPKGNFLGTFNAWAQTCRVPSAKSSVGLTSMVFGMGKRLSPFTQALGNRKAALPTPYRSRSEEWLCTADVSNLQSNVIVSHLARNGFSGQVIKWGDEILLASEDWEGAHFRFGEVDAIRFISQVQPTEELAREKEWILFEDASRLMTREYSRQGKWTPLSRPFFGRNKLWSGGSDLRSGAAEAAPAIPALESALGPHSCGALSSAQVPPL
jgi:hypothetical protein